MKMLRVFLILVAVCSLLIGQPITNRNVSAVTLKANDLSALTQQELAQARTATARYHDVAAAEADGYVNFNLCVSGEGCHYIKFSLLDDKFDPAAPEILIYAPAPGDRLRLVGVEYLVPIALSPEVPDGFTGDADEWRMDAEGFGLWELNAWIWLHNPEGVFAHDNPRLGAEE